MIKIIDGDIFESDADIIAHQVNCMGVMGSGVAKQVREKYPAVFTMYKVHCDFYSKVPEKLLGTCQTIKVKDKKERSIANLFGQLGFGYDGAQYTDINALKKAMIELRDLYAFEDRIIAMPYKIGCFRGGADWNEVYAMIGEVFKDYNVELWRLDKG